MVKRRKPLALDTTMRNPQRMANFISILSKYEGKVLTSDLIFRIEAEFIREKIFLPKTIGKYVPSFGSYVASDQSEGAADKVERIFSTWKDSKLEDQTVSIEDIEYLLHNTITKHGEKGYAYGWESRFKTQISFCNELGFTYIVKNQPVRISPTGKLLISQYKNGHPIENYDEDPEHTAFLNAFAKYQTNNPWRQNTISVNFLYLFLTTVNCLDKDYGSKGISRRELPFFIVWPNNNYKELAEYINKFRKVEGRQPSPEVVYAYAMNVLDDEAPEKFGKATAEFIKKKSRDYKFKKIEGETPDDVMRKLRQSQLVSLRGAGFYLDINHFEQAKVDRVMESYGQNIDFDTDYDKYFEYMGTIDEELVFKVQSVSEEQEKQIASVRASVLKIMANKYTWKQLSKEMSIACSKRDSHDDMLKIIDKPVRLEFLASITMQKALKDARVEPHYKVDDAGIPYSTASGGNSKNIGTDIDVFYQDMHALLEPTVSESRSIQVDHEIPSIRNHLIRTIERERKEGNKQIRSFAIFLAGKIDPDVGDSVAATKFINHIDIYPWETSDYTKTSEVADTLDSYAVIRPYSEPHRM